MVRSSFRLAILAAAPCLVLCLTTATVAQAQRTSTFEEDAAYRFAEGDHLGEAKLSSPQECRDRCVGDRACGAWLYASGINQCLMMRRAAQRETRSPPKDTDILKIRWYTGRIETAAASSTPSRPTAPPRETAPPAAASTDLFSQPRPGTEITRRHNNKEQYSRYKFLENDGHRTFAEVWAWEGPLALGDRVPGQARSTAWLVLNETPNRQNFSCTLSAGDEQIRRLIVGQELVYNRTCKRDYIFYGRPVTTTIVSRTKRRAIRMTKTTTAAGTFDAIEVHYEMNEELITSMHNGNETAVRQNNNERGTRFFVPSLGFYVREDMEIDVGIQVMAPWLLKEYQSSGVKPPTGGKRTNRTEAVSIR